jgi:hypothetical protein
LGGLHYFSNRGDFVMQTLSDVLGELAKQRVLVENATGPEDKAAKARDAVVGMLHFAQAFLGEDVIRAAYGEIDQDDRAEMLRVVSLRVLMASMLFAKMPDDAGSLDHVAAEAMAVAKGDAPVFFAQLSGARKRSWRVTRAKFEAFTWDAYLEGLGVEPATREGAITTAFGERSDTRRKWLRPARALLGDDYVDYHLGKAKTEGIGGKPYSLSQSFYDAKFGGPQTWQEALARDGERFRETLRARKAF